MWGKQIIWQPALMEGTKHSLGHGLTFITQPMFASSSSS
jgi:hypothetical protein